MPNNVLLRVVSVTAMYQPLASVPTIVSVTISTPPSNGANVFFLGDDGVSDVPWIPGEFHTFEHIDLSTLQVKGTAGDSVTLVGGTW